LVIVFSACSSDDDPFFTATENDAPRILNTDIPEGTAGEPGVIKTITRTENFTFEVMVTPVHYTTVAWFIDNQQVAEGLSVDVPVLAGDHIVKIVATTTKGLSTSRTCKLIVQPAEGDPTLAADGKSRWLTIGTTKTIECTNTTSVTRVFVGSKEAANVSFDNGRLTFDVPDMPEDEYTVVIEDASGTRYGCGLFIVSSEAYVDPGIKETVLWEGSVDINWGDANVNISAETMAAVPVGATIRMEYEMIEAEYHAMRITTPWWGDNPEDQVIAQFDITADTPNLFEFTYTQANKAIVDERGGMLIVGFGYRLTKVVLVEGVAPAETVLWEGSFAVTWGTPFEELKDELINHVQVGSVLRAYVTGEGQGCAATLWWRNLVTGFSDDDQGRGDTPISGDMVLEYTLTDLSIQLLTEQNGFLMVGDGYTLLKVTVE
jgi:hypothetical protein